MTEPNEITSASPVLSIFISSGRLGDEPSWKNSSFFSVLAMNFNPGTLIELSAIMTLLMPCERDGLSVVIFDK
jgi:hypothetical protein